MSRRRSARIPSNTTEQVQMNIYADLPLEPTEHSIRLIKFKAAKAREAPLVAEVFVASLDTNPRYAALSYRWGSSASMRQIECNGQALNITENLRLALSSFRQTSYLPLWVDQLCIDQEDVDERSRQVSLMHRIFSQACETYLYFGEAQTDATHAACRFIQEDPPKKFIPWKRYPLLPWLRYERILPGAACPPYARLERSPLDEDGSRALIEMAHNLVFTRRWIVQEIALSRSLFCLIGSHCLKWTSFINESLDRGMNYNFMHPSHYERIKCLRTLNLRFCLDLQRHPLLSLLYFSRAFQTTDPRDKIYALLGAASDSNDFPRPNYNIQVNTLYSDISNSIVQQGKGFLLLRLAGMTLVNNGLPSWVVDWRLLDASYFSKPFVSFHAGGEGGYVRTGMDRTTIHVLGNIVDRVQAVGEPFKTELDPLNRFEQYIRDCTRAFERVYDQSMDKLAIRKDLASLICFPINYRAIHCLWDRIHFDDDSFDVMHVEARVHADRNPSIKYPGLAARAGCSHVANYLLSKSSNRINKERVRRLVRTLGPKQTPRTLAMKEIKREEFKSHERDLLLRCAFFRDSTRPIITQRDKRLGLAPALTREGDVICVVRGAKAPYILRPAAADETGRTTYKFVGEAYVRGIMFGETLASESRREGSDEGKEEEKDVWPPWQEIVIG